MSIQTIDVQTSQDNTLKLASPTTIFANQILVGISGTNQGVRSISKVPIPDFVGTITSQKVRLYLSGRTVFTDRVVGVHIVDTPQDDLWVSVSPFGASWNEYTLGYAWTTGGGDFSSEPVSTLGFSGASSISTWYEFDIMLENFTFQPGKMYSFVLRFANENGAVQDLTFNPANAIIRLEIDVDGFDAVTVSAQGRNSVGIDVNWSRSALDEVNFKQYRVEWSNTGAFSGEEVTLATITDQDTLTTFHSPVVNQSMIDDYDEDNDTYPNGRTIYYRVVVETNEFTEVASTGISGTTIPAVRPISLSWERKSQYFAEGFIDNNISKRPYGILITPSWYDSVDTTVEQYVDDITYTYQFFQAIIGWAGTPPTFTGSAEDFTGGIQMPEYWAYTPYNIKAEIKDTGGLIRKATLDKTTEQQTVIWPAPCPVAVPSGPYGTTPPDMGGPFNGGDLMTVDLSYAGQQYGEPIYVEDFIGSTPLDSGRWGWSASGFNSPIYGVGTGGAPMISIAASSNFGTFQLNKILNGEGGVVNQYNEFIDMYTGAYHIRWIFKFDNTWDFTDGSGYFRLGTCGWTNLVGTLGIYIEFDSTTTIAKLYRNQNLAGGAATQIYQTDLTTDAPLVNANKNKFILVDLILSPSFSGNETDTVFFLYNIDATLAGVQNINYLTHPSKMIRLQEDSTRPGTNQTHYTGRPWAKFNWTGGAQIAAVLEFYDISILGRAFNPNLSGVNLYGAKNIETGEEYPTSTSPAPGYQISCKPEQSSQVIHIEGRIRNEYGAHSTTNEQDDYQGDTINNTSPTAVLFAQSSVFTGNPVSLNGSQSFDPEGGTLTYEFDFGEGGPTLVTTSSIVTHTYSTAGSYTVKLRVKDEAGNWSVWVEKIVTIVDFSEIPTVTFLAQNPFTNIEPTRPSGLRYDPLVNISENYLQNTKAGGRLFSVEGYTAQCDNTKTHAQLISDTKAELDTLDLYYKEGTIVEIVFPFYGRVRGVITDLTGAPNSDNISVAEWSFVFVEVTQFSLGP